LAESPLANRLTTTSSAAAARGRSAANAVANATADNPFRDSNIVAS
jgi:hypothetical protein